MCTSHYNTHLEVRYIGIIVIGACFPPNPHFFLPRAGHGHAAVQRRGLVVSGHGTVSTEIHSPNSLIVSRLVYWVRRCYCKYQWSKTVPSIGTEVSPALTRALFETLKQVGWFRRIFRDHIDEDPWKFFDSVGRVPSRDVLQSTYFLSLHYKWVVDIVIKPIWVWQMRYLVLAREDLINQV